MKSRRPVVLLSAATVLVLCFAAATPQLIAYVERNSTPQFQVPPSWPKPVYDFAANPVSAKGFALGRRLFYDPQLSRDGSTSCGSCHQQFAAFAHYDHPLSHGIDNQNGSRNAPGLFNLAWEPALMWDGSVHQLEVQPIAPISNPVEMGASLEQVVARLAAEPAYQHEFAAAFGSPGVDSQRMLKALAQFTGTLVSAGSRYDRYIAGDQTALNSTELSGLKLFRERCASCHVEPLFTDYSYRNNGLDAAPKDRGRATATGRDEDYARFRVPSLRNVEYSPPYMHDGRYDRLDQVLDHYSNGIQASPTLDPTLVGGLPLDAEQRTAVLAFLKTLSDEAFIRDPRFAEARQ